MTGEFETVFRRLLKSVVKEVADELLAERRISVDESTSHEPVQDDRLLIRVSEAAERLGISERHLWNLTNDGVLPCVRVGRIVRYRMETIEHWIRDAESTVPAPKISSAATSDRQTNSTKPTHTRKSTPKIKAKDIVTKPSLNRTKKNLQSKAETVRRQTNPDAQDVDRQNPFRLFLRQLGVDSDKVPSITNGELIRIAEVDIPTLHGWMYLNKNLPEEALEKLRCYFGGGRFGST